MNNFDFTPDAISDALLRQTSSIKSALEARIQQKLSGEVLQRRSGALADSIVVSVDDSDSSVSVFASSMGVAYAAIQEFGGKTAAHDIVALKAKALAFSAGGDAIFAKKVRHPGSILPARSYLATTQSEMEDSLVLTWKEALLETLRGG